MKKKQVKLLLTSSCEHNLYDYRYTYCPMCGSYFPPKGWRMAGGNPTRSSYLGRDISNAFPVGWPFGEEAPTDTLPLLLDNLVVVALNSSLACFNIETAELKWKTAVESSLTFASTPVFLRPFLFFATERKMWKIDLFRGDAELIDGEDSRVQPINTIPVAIEKEGAKKACFVFRDFVLFYEMGFKEQGLSPHWIPLPGKLALRSPVVWNNQLLFLSTNGTVYTIQENQLQLLVKLGDGEFSSPMLLQVDDSQWLVAESFYRGIHTLWAYHLQTKAPLRFDLGPFGNYDQARLRLWPVQAGPHHIAVSSSDLSALFLIDVPGKTQEKITVPQGLSIRHWQTLGNIQGVVGAAGACLQLINHEGAGIPLGDFAPGKTVQPLHLLADETYLVLIIGDRLFWREI